MSVKGLKMSGQIVRVCLAVNDSMPVLIARITRTSAELLALKPGLQVVAMCKATAVKVLTRRTRPIYLGQPVLRKGARFRR